MNKNDLVANVTSSAGLSKSDAAKAVDAVFGSRMMKGFNALKGGMPIYKFIGNKATTWVENKLIGTNLSEFHTGHQIYSIKIQKLLLTKQYHISKTIKIVY